ncbi:hypothetical protein GmHk_15G044817 [Glycine max]|nr:hypothetical protein GmHk_15G044817 [Glycine max]
MAVILALSVRLIPELVCFHELTFTFLNYLPGAKHALLAKPVFCTEHLGRAKRGSLDSQFSLLGFTLSMINSSNFNIFSRKNSNEVKITIICTKRKK